MIFGHEISLPVGAQCKTSQDILEADTSLHLNDTKTRILPFKSYK